jgi:hypothetical protein
MYIGTLSPSWFFMITLRLQSFSAACCRQLDALPDDVVYDVGRSRIWTGAMERDDKGKSHEPMRRIDLDHLLHYFEMTMKV